MVHALFISFYFMKKLFLASFFALLSICTYAYDFEVDGIRYKITGDNTVEVTSNNGTYTGDIIIPNKVSYDSKEYSVTSIGENAFYNCSSLTAIDIPASVTIIKHWAFVGCSSLTAIDIPASVTSIGNYVFRECYRLTAIDMPDGVKYIGDEAFALCSSLTAINIPASVTSIREATFRECSGLTAINIPVSVTSIGREAFAGCSGLTAINIPASVTSIGNSAFSGCSGLTVINIPVSMTSIGESTFGGCSGLTAINIPASVTGIGSWAFYNCGSLADIYCYASTPAGTISGTFSQNTYSGCTLHVPYGTMNAYRAAENWKDFTNIVEFDPTGVEAVSTDGKSTAEQRIYNLGGVRMAAPQRGLNIINGKKVAY